MAFYNGVYETSTTTGTGTYTLAGAFVASGATVSAYQTFAVVGDGNTCYYRAQDNQNGGWEYGVGTYTASGTTLARTTILGSSNANAAVSWVAGTRQIFLIEPAEVLVLLNAANTFTIGPQTINTGGDANKGVIVKANSLTQSANLLDLQTSTASPIFTVGADGRIIINVSAGAASPPSIIAVTLQHNLPDTVTNASLVGYLSGVATGAANTHNQLSLKGADLVAEHDGSGTITLVCGSDFNGEHFGSALATSVVGGRGIARNHSTGAVTTLSGMLSIWGNFGAGVVASAAAFSTTEVGGGGPITNNYGYIVSSLTQGTNNYGFYSGVTAAANAFAFHGAGTAVSYFGGPVGVGAIAPVASAAFQVDSTTQGQLPPRMTSTQKNAIATPATGLSVYDTTLKAKCVYNGTAWLVESPAGITVDPDAAPVAIDWSNTWHSTTLTASRTITFSNDVDGGTITIIFKSGGTGAWTPVWPATVKWLNGVAPVLTNVSGHWDLVSIKRESSGNYIGTFSPNYF